ncbi:MAG: hypothetical protein ACKODH_14570, partial [Limisphaerales bacterium]
MRESNQMNITTPMTTASQRIERKNFAIALRSVAEGIGGSDAAAGDVGGVGLFGTAGGGAGAADLAARGDGFRRQP